MATILPLDDSRVMIQHIADRACIGHCFSYGNYEAGSEVFRVRAMPGQSVRDEQITKMPSIWKRALRGDSRRICPRTKCISPPRDGTRLCIRPLQAGEENNRLGVSGTSSYLSRPKTSDAGLRADMNPAIGDHRA